jgi:hypothetical protein
MTVAVHGKTRAVVNLASSFVFNARIKFAKFARAAVNRRSAVNEVNGYDIFSRPQNESIIVS